MAIEQQLHCMDSANPSKCSASSKRRVLCPLPRPGTRDLRCGFGLPVKVATGRAFLSIVISSPGTSYGIRDVNFS